MRDVVTLTTPSIQLSVDPKRGNIITSLCVKGKQWIYIDKENYQSEERPRCGCPILFPYMGSLPNDELHLFDHIYPASIHGVVHSNKWKVLSQSDTSASFVTTANEVSKVSFPYDFILTSTITIQENRVHYHVKIENTSKQQMPCDIGFHPFFQMPKLKNSSLYMDDKKVELSDALYSSIFTTGYLYEDVHTIHVQDDQHGFTLYLDKNLPNLFLWSGQPDKFLVIEPWTSYNNAINEGKQYFMIAPKDACEVAWHIDFN